MMTDAAHGRAWRRPNPTMMVALRGPAWSQPAMVGASKGRTWVSPRVSCRRREALACNPAPPHRCNARPRAKRREVRMLENAASLDRSTWDPALDAVVAAPRNHKVLFEN